MSDHDDAVSRRYRELGRDEPPAALDAAILAHARGQVVRARSQWVRGLSVAAVIVLALGITLRMQREQPGIEMSEPRTAPPAVAPTTVSPQAPPPEPSTPAARAETSREAPTGPPVRAKDARVHAGPTTAKQIARPEPFTAEPPSPARTAPQELPSREAATMPKAEALDAVPSPPLRAPATSAADAQPTANAQRMRQAPSAASPAPPSTSPAGAAAPPLQKRAQDNAADAPEVELERIAALREAGRDADADAALARFRERHPDYRIPDATWARVKQR